MLKMLKDILAKLINISWMNKKGRIITVIVLVLLLLLVIMRARSGFITIEVENVSKGNILSTISASGIVESKTVKLGSAAMSGRVDWVGVEEGDRVSRSQILVKLNGYTQAYKEYKRFKELHKQGFVSDMELERGKTALDNARISSPIDGVVTDKAITLGEAVSMGSPLLTVVDIDNPWAEIQIDEVDIAKVSLGQRVKFTTDAYPEQEFFGRISWINKEAELKKVGGRVRMDEEDLVFRAKVEFEEGTDALKPGMSIYSEVIVGEKKDVVVVPRAAVTLRDGKKVVFVVRGKRVKQIGIEVGEKDMEKVEVVSGVSAEEVVAVSGIEKLKDKSKVIIEKK